MTNKEKVLEAYKKYAEEFDYEEINKIQFGQEQFYITESEFLYSLVRDIKPITVVEISPDQGFTTLIILKALEKNDLSARLFSFDVHDKSKKYDHDGMITRELIVGDAKETVEDSLLEKADFVFIDSDHAYHFGKWYSKKLQILRPGTLIMVHDWPMYASNGASNNIVAEKAQSTFKEELHNLEVLAVKQYFIDKGYANPVMNVTDWLKETGKPYYHTRDGVMFRALSPSQILVKT